MSDSADPLLPAAFDLVWSSVVVLVLALIIVALISLARNARQLTSTQALVWTIVVIFVPVIGPIAWFSIGRRSGSVQTPLRTDR